MIGSIQRLYHRARAMFRREELDGDLKRELDSHLAAAIDDFVRSGHSPQEAERLAKSALGGVTAAVQQHRESRGAPWFEQLWQDVRYGWRTLRREAAASIFAVLIVGFGAGASATVFSVVNALLLRPLPFSDSERLVWIGNIADNGVDEWKVQVNHHLDLREQSSSFANITAYSDFYGFRESKIMGVDGLRRVTRAPVTCDFLPVLGVQPHLGRNFTTDECQQNSSGAVLLSFGLWRNEYGGDPGIAGRTIVLDGAPATVAGVLPREFDFGSIFDPARPVDVIAPFPLSDQTNRRGNILSVVGRLKPGVPLDRARAELQTLGRQLTESHPERNTIRPKLTALDEKVSGRFRPALLVLAAAIAAVMLIVCANLSNIQLSRMAARQKEMAVRAALGAGRGRLVQQLLTESLLLSMMGGLLAFGVAAIGIRGLSRLDAFNIPLLRTVELDVATCAFLVLLTVCTGVGFGLLPALRAPFAASHGVLKEQDRSSSGTRSQAATRGVLVAAEVAFACLLLFTSGLLIQSFLRVLDVPLGFRPQGIAALRIDVNQFSDQARRNAHIDETLNRMRQATGISAATVADVLPLGGNRSRGVAGQGQVYARDRYPQGYVRIVGDGYFDTLGIPIRSGRDFTPLDTPAREPVVIVNETLARMLWPGQEAVGQILSRGAGPSRRVVGVAGDVRHVALEAGFTGEFYVPVRQTNDYAGIDVVVRTNLPASSLAATARAGQRRLGQTRCDGRRLPLAQARR